MKKLLYVTFVDFSDQLSNGVIKKILSHIKVFDSNGYDVYCIAQYGNGVCKFSSYQEKVLTRNNQSVGKRKMLYKHVREYCSNNEVDFAYIRYQFSCPYLIKLIKVLRNKNVKSILEIPTYPYESELKYQGIRGWMKLTIDRIYRGRIKGNIDRILTFSSDREIFGLDTINTVNGIDFSQHRMKKVAPVSQAITVIAVASMFPWHGYDRFIEGLKDYYCNNGDRHIILHLVGTGVELSYYKALVEIYKLQHHVLFHEALFGDELDRVYDSSDIALATLAIHRIRLSTVSPLKSREYGARGIPFITSCKEDVYGDDFDYMLQIPADESSVDIEQFVAFYDYVYGSKKQRQQIISEIRAYVSDKCDIKSTLKSVIDFYEAQRLRSNI